MSTLLEAFAPRQREHIEILTRPDIGWRVTAVVLSRDGEKQELVAPVEKTNDHS